MSTDEADALAALPTLPSHDPQTGHGGTEHAAAIHAPQHTASTDVDMDATPSHDGPTSNGAARDRRDGTLLPYAKKKPSTLNITVDSGKRNAPLYNFKCEYSAEKGRFTVHCGRHKDRCTNIDTGTHVV